MLENLFIFCGFVFYQFPSLILLSIISNIKNKEIKYNLKYILYSLILLWTWLFLIHLSDSESSINKLLSWFN